MTSDLLEPATMQTVARPVIGAAGVSCGD
jgi:hypothetical protein